MQNNTQMQWKNCHQSKKKQQQTQTNKNGNNKRKGNTIWEKQIGIKQTSTI